MENKQRTIKPPLPSVTKGNGRKLRKDSTHAESAVWRRLRGGQLGGLKFRRQHPIPPYIVDFYCEARKLVIELDGSQHSIEGDRARTEFLKRKGLMVLRFHANDAVRSTDAVVEAIWNAVGHRTLTPTPLPEGEGLKSEQT